MVGERRADHQADPNLCEHLWCEDGVVHAAVDQVFFGLALARKERIGALGIVAEDRNEDEVIDARGTRRVDQVAVALHFDREGVVVAPAQRGVGRGDDRLHAGDRRVERRPVFQVSVYRLRTRGQQCLRVDGHALLCQLCRGRVLPQQDAHLLALRQQAQRNVAPQVARSPDDENLRPAGLARDIFLARAARNGPRSIRHLATPFAEITYRINAGRTAITQ